MTTNTDNSRRSPITAVLMLLVAMASIQAGASLAKTLFHIVGAPGAVALRTALATVMLLLFMRPWKAWGSLTRESWPALAVYGVSLGVMNFLYYMALRTVPLGITVALEFTGPLAVAVLSSRRAIDFLWIVLAATGLLFLLPLRHAQVGIDPVGALYALGAGTCWALYIVFGQKAGHYFGPAAVALGSVIAAVIVVPVGVAAAGAVLLLPSALLYGLAIALFSTALPYTLEMVALTRLPSRTFGVLMSIEPAFGALFGWMILHEVLSVPQWTAIAMIIFASLGTTLTATAHQSSPVPMPE